jgi:hypothetical protein
MTALFDEKEAEKTELLSREAELMLAQDLTRKDLKESRGVIKQSMYDGSKKLKHVVPKGKHI